MPWLLLSFCDQNAIIGGSAGSFDRPEVFLVSTTQWPDWTPYSSVGSHEAGDRAAHEQALRSVVLYGQFVGEADSIWCPVGDFIGSGAGGRPATSWFRTVDDRGDAVGRWTMPYAKEGRLTLHNYGDRAVQVQRDTSVGPWNWDERSMHFHCSWHQQVQIPARPFRDWNFVSVNGRGVMVGDVMSVFNPLPSWYGEGNQATQIDGTITFGLLTSRIRQVELDSRPQQHLNVQERGSEACTAPTAHRPR